MRLHEKALNPIYINKFNSIEEKFPVDEAKEVCNVREGIDAKTKQGYNLAYRIKRLIQGESGIVLKVDPVDTTNKTFIPNYEKDHFGNFPMTVTFRNPLGELEQGMTPITTKTIKKYDRLTTHQLRVYKRYKIGEQYP